MTKRAGPPECNSARHRPAFQESPLCICGQVPGGYLDVRRCDCGSPPVYDGRKHLAECAWVQWARHRDAWTAKHPEVSPPLELLHPQITARPTWPVLVRTPLALCTRCDKKLTTDGEVGYCWSCGYQDYAALDPREASLVVNEGPLYHPAQRTERRFAGR